MNYLKLFAVAAFAIGAILYFANSDDHRVVMGEQEYDLGEYVKISVKNDVDLRVKAGEDYALNVRAGENDLKNLKIYVRGQTLVIENREMMFNDRQGERPEIEIYMPLLKQITLKGSAYARIEAIHGAFFAATIKGSGGLDGTEFEVEECDVKINGSGSVRLLGKCKQLAVEIKGSGDFSGKDFQCEKVYVDAEGSGDMEVFASKIIKLDVTGSGEINVYGKPEYVKDKSYDKASIIIH